MNVTLREVSLEELPVSDRLFSMPENRRWKRPTLGGD